MDLSEQISEVLDNYGTLHFDEAKNEILGDLYITKTDSYSLKISLDPYPDFFPEVWETEGRIPKKADRHIYENRKSCCFTTSAKAQILLRTKIPSLYKFIEHIVIPYLRNNSFFEIKGKYKTDEYAHGMMGVVEGYRDILQLSDDMLVANLIYQKINGEKLRISDRCYCNSGASLKKCKGGLHDRCYRDFRKIEKGLLEYDFREHFFPFLKGTGQLD